jgi:hypothetical protein
MKKVTEFNFLALSVVTSVFFFIPVFLNKNIGSDWDSYALIGTYINYTELGVYIPSRPPGFPIYELLVGIIASLSSSMSFLSFEQGLLITQFLTLISLNGLIYKFFNRNNNRNILFYLLIVFSPIYLISGLSIIDYFIGSLFGFSALYTALYKSNSSHIFLISILLSLSIGVRLSNVIFLFVILVLFFLKNKNQALVVGVLTTILSCLIYFPFYLNLYNFYINAGVYDSISEMTCIVNLTNTDHNIIGRLGRFILKQINYLGTLGFIVFLFLLKDIKMKTSNTTISLFAIFLFFQLSFLRLPTEEGHLLPSFIALMILLSHLNGFNMKILLFAVFFTFLSNFIDIKLYEVDEVDSASEITINLFVKEGFFIEDYKLRNYRAVNKDFNYSNSQSTLFDAWKNGCPN